MRLLLDTHTFLWWCADDARLSEPARQGIADAENEVYLSAASSWEIAIKTRIGKLDLGEAPETFMLRMLEHHAFGVLPISLRHTLRDYDLPTHHSDPFDRLLVAQAQLDALTLVTDDGKIARYAVTCLW